MKKHLNFAPYLIILILFTLAYWLVYDLLVQIVQIVVILGAVAIASFVGWLVFALRENILLKRAKRIEAQRVAHVQVVVAKQGEQVFIRDTDKEAHWQNRTLNPQIYANGHYSEPSKFELNIWQQYLTMVNKPSAKQVEQNNLVIDQQNQHLFDLLGKYPHSLVVGGTGSGKTTIINHIVEWYVKCGDELNVYWLSTHLYQDGNENKVHSKALCVQAESDIVVLLKEIVRIYKARRDKGTVGKKLVVVCDEWSELARDVPGVGNYLMTLSRGARKFNINLILAAHGQNVDDLDISGHSDVKNDFARILLYSHLTPNGKAIWQPGKSIKSQVEIDIPGQFISDSKPRVLQLPDSVQSVCANPECDNLTDGRTYCEQSYDACKQMAYRLRSVTK